MARYFPGIPATPHISGETSRRVVRLHPGRRSRRKKRAPADGLDATTADAFAEYGRNARFPHTGGVVEDQDGELVTVFDEDAGF
jgi:hypothetical protein